MLTQTYSRHVPGADASITRTLIRDASFCVAVLELRGLALDRGALGHALHFPTRFRRPQLTVLLSGRGYLRTATGVTTLRTGDVVESHQLAHLAEGYGGDACEVLIVDWKDESPLAPRRLSRLGEPELARLRALTAVVNKTAPERWVLELSSCLQSLGFHRPLVTELTSSPAPLRKLYAAVGAALSSLHTQPSLLELAQSLGLSERQVHRQFEQLPHSFASWRELLHESRLDWTTQLLSVPGLPLGQVAQLAGYRSTIALHHALSLRGAATPSAISRGLAERWR